MSYPTIEGLEDEVINLRAQLRREQDARAELRIELDQLRNCAVCPECGLRVKVDEDGCGATCGRDCLLLENGRPVANFVDHLDGMDRALQQAKDELAETRRDLVAAMQTIEAASTALGGVREQREQPGELEEGDRG